MINDLRMRAFGIFERKLKLKQCARGAYKFSRNGVAGFILWIEKVYRARTGENFRKRPQRISKNFNETNLMK